MNKKILTCVLFLGLVAGLTGCKKETFSDKILKDEDNAAWVLHGQFKLADGTDNGWNGKDSALYTKSSMHATSIKAVSEINIDLARALNGKNVKYLYIYEGAQLGVSDAGWTTRYHVGNDFYHTNGSYVFKGAKVSYDAEDDVWAETQWIHDPKTAHAEALTENIFMPTWKEGLDDWGFSWKNNLCIKGGQAGKYTIIIAQYDVVQSATVPGYGIAAIKTEAATGGQEAVKEDTFDPTAHTYGVIGSFAGSGWGTDVAMTGSEYGPYVASVTFAAGDEWKIRLDGAWDVSFGWDNLDLDNVPEGAFEDPENGNIKATVAGTYQIKLNFSAAGIGLISAIPANE